MAENQENEVVVITQSRWKSPVFWGSVVVTVVSILAMFGVFTDEIAAKISGAVGMLLSVIVGNYNNSTNPMGIGANKAIKK